MKLDLMVYGRGVERLAGYQQFAAPAYWTEDMLVAMDRFNELWMNGDQHDHLPQAFANNDNPWADTYMFICMPPPYCCALLRCTRVEGDQPGTWLKEARNFDVWSMEGWCCPYDQRDRFFALLPSLLLWMQKDRTSLYGRLRHGRIATSIMLPEEIIYNPLLDVRPPEHLLALLLDDNTRSSFIALNNAVNQSSFPFQFLFGPLAEYFNAEIGAHYGIRSVFSTLHGAAAEEFPDAMQRVNYIQERPIHREFHQCSLQYCPVHHGRGEEERCWRVRDLQLTGEKQDFIRTAAEFFSTEHGVKMQRLCAEAEVLRDFAVHLEMEVSTNKQDPTQYYIFRREV